MKGPSSNNLYRDSEIKNLIHSYAHGIISSTVNSTLKSDSLPDVGKKGSVDQGIVNISAGWGFKAGKTQVVDIATLHKEESSGKKSGKKTFTDTKLKPASKSI